MTGGRLPAGRIGDLALNRAIPAIPAINAAPAAI